MSTRLINTGSENPWNNAMFLQGLSRAHQRINVRQDVLDMNAELNEEKKLMLAARSWKNLGEIHKELVQTTEKPSRDGLFVFYTLIADQGGKYSLDLVKMLIAGEHAYIRDQIRQNPSAEPKKAKAELLFKMIMGQFEAFQKRFTQEILPELENLPEAALEPLPVNALTDVIETVRTSDPKSPLISVASVLGQALRPNTGTYDMDPQTQVPAVENLDDGELELEISSFSNGDDIDTDDGEDAELDLDEDQETFNDGYIIPDWSDQDDQDDDDNEVIITFMNDLDPDQHPLSFLDIEFNEGDQPEYSTDWTTQGRTLDLSGTPTRTFMDPEVAPEEKSFQMLETKMDDEEDNGEADDEKAKKEQAWINACNRGGKTVLTHDDLEKAGIKATRRIKRFTVIKPDPLSSCVLRYSEEQPASAGEIHSDLYEYDPERKVWEGINPTDEEKEQILEELLSSGNNPTPEILRDYGFELLENAKNYTLERNANGAPALGCSCDLNRYKYNIETQCWEEVESELPPDAPREYANKQSTAIIPEEYSAALEHLKNTELSEGDTPVTGIPRDIFFTGSPHLDPLPDNKKSEDWGDTWN